MTAVRVLPHLLPSLNPRHTAAEKYNLTSLSMIYSGAAALGAPLAAAAHKKLSSVGANVIIGQGSYIRCDFALVLMGW